MYYKIIHVLQVFSFVKRYVVVANSTSNCNFKSREIFHKDDQMLSLDFTKTSKKYKKESIFFKEIDKYF